MIQKQQQSVQLPSEVMVPARQGLHQGPVAQVALECMTRQQVGAEKDESTAPGSWGRPLANCQKKLGHTFERDSFLSS